MTPELKAQLDALREREQEEARKRAALQAELEEREALKEQQERAAAEENDGLLNNTWEVLGSALERATEQVVRTVGDVASSASDALDERFGRTNQIVIGESDWVESEQEGRGIKVPFTSKRVAIVKPDEYDKLEKTFRERTGREVARVSDFELPDVDRPDSGLGQAASAIIQFGLTFAATRKATGLGVVPSSIIADFSAFDPYEDRLSNLAREWGKDNPVFDNALTEFLSANEDDSAIEGRFKQALEGLGIGVAMDTALYSFRWLRRYRKAKAEAAEGERLRDEAEAGPLSDTPVSSADEPVSPPADAVEGTVSSADEAQTRFAVANTDDGLRVVPKDANRDLDAFMDIEETDEAVKVIYPWVEKQARDNGLGIEMYVEAAEYALSNGKVFVSDNQLSIQARRVWKALEERGYVIEKNTDLHPPTRLGVMHTVNGEPMFRVVGKSGDVTRRTVSRRLDVLGTAVRRMGGDLSIAGRRAVRQQLDPDEAADLAERILDTTLGNRPRPGPDGTPIVNVMDPGLIPWERLGQKAGDLSDVFESVVRYNLDIFKAAGKTVSLEDARRAAVRLASETGDDPMKVLKETTLTGAPGEVMARQAAGKMLLDASADRIQTLAREVQSGAVGSAGRKQLEIQITRHHALLALVRSNASESARLMRMQRELVKALDSHDDVFRQLVSDFGRDPDSSDIVRELAGLTSTERVTKAVSSLQPGKTSSRFFTYWYGQLLSNPVSWVANTLGPMFNVAWNLVAELPTAAVIGAVRGSADRVTAAQVRSAWFGAAVGAKLAFKFPLKHYFGSKGLNALNPKEFAEYVTSHADTVGTLYRTIATGEAQTRASTKFANRANDAFERPAELTQDLLDEMTVRQRALRGMHVLADRLGLVKLGNVGLKAWKLPGGVFAATDEVFSTIAYHQKYYEELYRAADMQLRAELRNGKLFPTARHQREYVEGLMRNLHESGVHKRHLAEVADKYAAYTTFQSPLELKAQPLQTLQSRNPILRLFIPFIRTPTNIFKQAFIERTPWPWIKAIGSKQQRELLKGGAEADVIMAKAMLGTGFLGSAALYAMEGNITGSGEPGQNSEDLRGVPPYSIRIGGKWYQYNRLEPVGMIIGLAADIVEAGKRLADAPESPENDHWYEQLGILSAGVGFAIVENMFSKTYLQGVSDLVGILDGDEQAKDRVKNSLGFSLLVPGGSGLRSVGTWTDPWAREAFDFIDRLKAQIPVVRESLPMRRDWLGRPVPTAERAGPDMLSPVIVSTETDDPLMKELARLKFPLPKLDRRIRGVELTAQEYSELLRLRGQHEFPGGSLEDYLREWIKSDEYSSDLLTDEGRAEAISNIVNRYSNAARAKMVADSEDLQERIADLKARQEAALRRREPPSEEDETAQQAADVIKMLTGSE